MLSSKNVWTIGLLLCTFFMGPAIRLAAQDKPKVAPPNKSDSFETDQDGKKFRVQHREIDATNVRIAGVDLTKNEEVLDQAAKTLGKVPTVFTGDASTANERACYRSMGSNNVTYLRFDRGEVSPSFTLTSDRSDLNPKQVCLRTDKITRNTATEYGLRIGQTQDQVIAILGLPTTHRRNLREYKDDLIYTCSSKVKKDPKEISRLRKENPTIRIGIFRDYYEFYDLGVSIHATFVSDQLTKLNVDWSETD